VLWHCWLGGRKGILPVKNWVVGCWHGYLSGVRCRLAYGPADATATHCLLLNIIQIGFTFLVPSHPGSPGKGPLNGCFFFQDRQFLVFPVITAACWWLCLTGKVWLPISVVPYVNHRQKSGSKFIETFSLHETAKKDTSSRSLHIVTLWRRSSGISAGDLLRLLCSQSGKTDVHTTYWKSAITQCMLPYHVTSTSANNILLSNDNCNSHYWHPVNFNHHLTKPFSNTATYRVTYRKLPLIWQSRCTSYPTV